MIHSVDSIRLLRCIEQEAAKRSEPTRILLEVNISADAAKHGFAPEDVEPILQTMPQCPHVRLCGLMAMAGREGVTLVSLMEHHSNDLPHRARGEVRHFGVRDDGTLDYEDLETKLRENDVKLVAVTGASNVTGYLPDFA